MSMIIIILQMESQQLKQASPEAPKEKNIFAKVGQMSLEKHPYQQRNITKSKRQFQNKILQEINNDDEFRPIPNITTTYLPLPSSQQTLSSENQKPKKQWSKNILKLDDSQYENVTSKIRQHSQSVLSNLSKKKYEKTKKIRLQEDQDLTGIEEIIDDIQRVMQESLANTKIQAPFKKDVEVKHHSAKRNFQSKGIHKFGQNDSLSKLQEMLQKYQINDHQATTEQKPAQITLKDSVSHRRVKNQQRMNRFKEYNEVSKLLAESQIKPKAEQKLKTTIQSMKKPFKEIGQNGISFQNIQILQIDWFKLPLFLAPLSFESAQLSLKLKDYPDDESFWVAINESLSGEKEYNAYSIFNRQYQAGIKKNNTLMSQEEFRQKWAQQWAYDIEQEQHKELLGELDFQWYRSLVQATFKQSIEDMLVKNIKYDIQQLRKALKVIQNSSTNDKNILSSSNLPLMVNQNKLKYVEALLNSLSYSKAAKTNQKELFVAVFPNIGHAQSQQIMQVLKNNLQQMFEGGLYFSDPEGFSMGVVITKKQAADCKVEKEKDKGIQLGSVKLLINQTESNRGEDTIYLNKGKSKNSHIKLRVLKSGEEGLDLQVGQEIYVGRRYHILLD